MLNISVPSTTGSSFFAGIDALLQIYILSDYHARVNGAFGCLFGLIVSAFAVVLQLLMILPLFLDRLILGITNGCFGKDYDYVLFVGYKVHVYKTAYVEAEKASIATQGFSKARKTELLDALRYVVNARIVFQGASPHRGQRHENYLSVRLDRLLKMLSLPENKRLMKLSQQEVDEVADVLASLSRPQAKQQQQQPYFTNLILRFSAHQQQPEKGDDDDNRGEEDEASVGSKGSRGSRGSLKRSLSDISTRIKGTIHNMLSGNTDKYADTEVSFSMFLHCLHLVSKERYQHKSRRSFRDSSFFTKDKIDVSNIDGFSEYLF